MRGAPNIYKQAAILFLLCMLYTTAAHAQGGKWVWVNGSTGGKYHYGTKQKFDSTNYPPRRYECAYWIDLKGNLWLYGSSQYNSDLWEYDTKRSAWAWMSGDSGTSLKKGVYGSKGVPSASNHPPSLGYGANCWTDKKGDLWIFGGYGIDSAGGYGYQNDLWRYTISTNEWAWMGGSKIAGLAGKYGTMKVEAGTNWPAGIGETKSGWVDDSNNLWMFGGINFLSSFENNDMWRYSISTGKWAWMKGDHSTGGIKGHYHKLGVEDSTALPKARGSYTRWKDCDGNFYVYSGFNAYNDMWKFNPKTNNWTWIWGDTSRNDTGKYKPYCTTSGFPTYTYESTSPAFVTPNSVMWNFAGYASIVTGYLNSLMYFNVSTNKWTRVSGTGKVNDAGHYGTKGVASKSNSPPARMGQAMWTDSAQILWMFGGYVNGYPSCNDMWKFIPDTSCIHFKPCLAPVALLTPPADSIICLGKKVNLSFNGFNNISVTPAGLAYADSFKKSITFAPTVTTLFTVSYTSSSQKEKLSFTVHVLQPDTVYRDTGLCAGSTYTLPKGEKVNAPGRYRDTFSNHNGCDSIIVTTIHIKPLKYRSKNPVICANQTYTLPKGEIVHNTGVYLDTFTSNNGCDSIISTTLQVNTIDSVSLSASICRGHTYTLPKGKSVHTPGRYIDTLRNANGCDSIITTTLYVNPIPSVTIAADICTGQTYTLPDGKNVNADGTYIDTVYEQNGCDSIITTTLTVHPLPKAGFTLSNPNVIIEDNPDVAVHNTSTNWTALTWLWDGVPFWHGTDTTITVYRHGYYCITLKAFNSIGCVDTATLCLTAHDTTIIAVPAAFTPNGDGNNDVFYPITRGDMHIIEFKVYNRWGQLLYDKTVRGWDGTYNGKPQPQDTYIYIVVAEDLLNPNAPKKVTQKGDVELIR